MLSSNELEQLKQEILTEVRQEVQKAKAEIIEGTETVHGQHYLDNWLFLIFFSISVCRFHFI